MRAKDLKELESRTLEGSDLVLEQFDLALESLRSHDLELAETVVADDDRIDRRYLEIHQGVLALLARQAPVAGDLRLVAALLHMIRCVERMGDQCVNIAKLVPLSGEQATNDKAMLDAIERMAQLARRQLTEGRAVERSERQGAVLGGEPAARLRVGTLALLVGCATFLIVTPN